MPFADHGAATASCSPTPSAWCEQATVKLALGWEEDANAGLTFQAVQLGGGIKETDTSTLAITIKPSNPCASALFLVKPKLFKG